MSDQTIVYGIHAVTQLLKEQAESLSALYWDAKRKDNAIENIVGLAKAQGVTLHVLTREKLDLMAGAVHHQGVVARLALAPVYTPEAIFECIQNAPNPLVLILDCIQDPHNLGACLRSALAFGVTAVVVPQDKACLINATVSKVASGAAQLIPFLAVKNIARFMETIKAMGIWCVGMSAHTDTPLTAINLTGPIALVMGSEGSGLRQLTEKNCDYLAKIELIGAMESLNVSVATGISLYEVSRQRSITSS